MKSKRIIRIIKIISGLLLLFNITLTIMNISNASEEMIDTYKQLQNVGDNTNTTDMAYNVVSIVMITLQVVAVGVALIVLVILGIKYLTASAGEKAEIKKNMIVYTVGTLIVFASASILKLIQSFFSQFNEFN